MNCHTLLYAVDNPDETAKEYVYSIFDQTKLSTEASRRYSENAIRPKIDATMQIAWVMQNWSSLSDDTRNELRSYVNPDALGQGGDIRAVFRRVLPRVAALQNEKSHTSAHFEIFYSTSDPHNAVSLVDNLNSNLEKVANGVSDYIDTMAYRLEKTYKLQVTEKGFPAPPFFPGESRYPVYVVDFLNCGYLYDEIADYLGSCNGGTLGLTMSVGETFPFPSLTVLDRRYDDDINVMNETIVHEFFHSIQFGRSNGPKNSGNLWYYEGTAVWMEDESWNSNGYIDDFLTETDYQCVNWFLCTNYSIDTDYTGSDYGMYPYGKVVFYKYLTEYLGKSDAVKDIQNLAVSNQNAIESVKQYVTNTLKTTMGDVFLGFGMSYLDLDKYSDGSLYHPEAGFLKSNVTKSRTFSNSNAVVRHYSYKTYDFYYTGSPGIISVTTSGDSDVKFAAVKCTGELSGCESLSMGESISDFGGLYQHIYLVVANGSSTDNNPSYSISVDFEAPTEYTVNLDQDKWNLVFFPIIPSSINPYYVFGDQGLQKILISKPITYEILDEEGMQFEQFTLASSLWIYNEENTTGISFFGRKLTYNVITFDVTMGNWTFIGTPDTQTPTPYADSNVFITANSVDYTLSEAIAAELIGNLYEYDSSTGGYVVVSPQTGVLNPWRAYALKPNFAGNINVYK